MEVSVPERQAGRISGLPSQEELQEAIAFCPLIEKVDASLLWVIIKIFAASRDKRVKRGGYLFLAHLLRLGTLVQRSLFAGTEVGDVARIPIPNILKLCLNRRKNGWAWCYDTTLKYLRLLVAAGILITRPDEPGIYYLSLGPYALLPEYTTRQVEKLAGQRSKVSRSAAFKRTTLHSALLEEPWMVDSTGREMLVLDETEMQRMVQALCTAVQTQGIALQSSTLVEMTRVVAKHAPRVLKKGDGRFVVRRKVVDSSEHESTTFALQGTQTGANAHTNLLSGPGIERTGREESTTLPSNLPVDPHMVDSSRAALSESLFTTAKDFTSENTISENGAAESTILPSGPKLVDSCLPAHPLAATFTPSVMLSWRFPVEERHTSVAEGPKDPDTLAALLSDFFEGNDSRTKYYRKRVGQDPRMLDLAVVDSIVRSAFPDKRHKQDHLGGAWVTQQFLAYRSGEQTEEVIAAWANTSYSYERMETMLEEAASWQEAQGQPRRRPLPEEIIVDSELIGDFWACGAAQGLKDAGYFGVDLDGDLLTCKEYGKRKSMLMQCKLDTDPLALSPEVEAEVEAFHTWNAPWICDREAEAKLLANLPKKLLPYLHNLEQTLDADRYGVEVRVMPLSRRPVIVVSQRQDSTQSWDLHPSDADAFIEWYKHTSLEAESPLNDQSARLLPREDRPDGDETGEEKDRDFTIGHYTVQFDVGGCTIEREGMQERYRLTAHTARNGTDLVQHHRDVILAMTNDRPEQLQNDRRVEKGEQAGNGVVQKKEG